ncbi:MAG: DM13 domain-containing protein [Nitratireductor sp.]
MLRFLKIAVPVFILGFAAGNAFWYLFSPLWIDRVVSEVAPIGAQSTGRVGTFKDADAAHKGSGKAELLKLGGADILRFTNFQVTNGPDLEVWLVEAPTPQNSSDVKNSKWLSLGVLKGNKGDQSYQIPQGTDLSKYGSAVIWCEQFGVLFASATLK